MALTSVGPDIEPKRLDTGKFDFDMSTSGSNKGNPKLGGSRTHAVMTTLFSWKRGRRAGDTVDQGGYYWDASGRRGTLLWTVLYDRQSTRSQLIAAAEDGLQQLVDQKFITSFAQPEARRIGVGPGKWGLSVVWSTPSGDRRITL